MTWTPESLAVGDAVVVASGGRKDVSRVDRVTKTQVIVGVCRFRRADGRGVGDWGVWGQRPYLREATPAAIAAIGESAIRADAIDRIRKVRFNDTATAALVAAANLLTKTSP